MFFFTTIPRPPRPTLFPYTMLFRSRPDPCLSARAGPQKGRARPAAECGESRQPECQEHGKRGIAGSVGYDGGKQLKGRDRKSTRLNSCHVSISYAVFCLKKKKKKRT